MIKDTVPLIFFREFTSDRLPVLLVVLLKKTQRAHSRSASPIKNPPLSQCKPIPWAVATNEKYYSGE